MKPQHSQYVRPEAIVARFLSVDEPKIKVTLDEIEEIGVRIFYQGKPLDLTIFDRFEFYGLTDYIVDSAFTEDLGIGDLANQIFIDRNALAPSKSMKQTILIGYHEENFPAGVVLWHPDMGRSSVAIYAL